ncbi:MAG: hypothetical protein F6K41_22580, partial [Symploca sp. SIO3E6]|nr:hypothetical protein [Caldora sp. SIO3E6]
QEAGGRRQEAGGRRQEAGGRRQEAGGRRQEAGGRRQNPPLTPPWRGTGGSPDEKIFFTTMHENLSRPVRCVSASGASLSSQEVC